MSMQQLLYILWRRFWIVGLTFVSTLAGAAAVLLLVPPRYDGVATASIDPGQADPISGQLNGGPNVMIMQGNLIALARSHQVALEVVKRLDLTANRQVVNDYNASGAAGIANINDWMADEILKHEEAKFAVESNVITITYKSSSPAQSALIANTFLSAFIDAAIEAKGSAAQQAAQWFDPQIDKLRKDLANARDNLAHYQIQSNLLGPTSAGDSENDQLMAVTAELSRARSDLVSLESHLAGPIDAAAESNDAQSIDLSTLTTLRSNLTAVNADIGKLQVEVGANNPKLVERLSTRKSLMDQIQAQVTGYKKKLEERIVAQKGKLAFLESARADQMKRMIDVQAKRDELASLTREVEFRQDAVDRAAKAALQARLQSQLSFSNISVIDRASPPTSASFPKPLLIALGAVGLGSALGLVLALIAEALDRRVRNAPDLDFAASTPVLGQLVAARAKASRALGRSLFRPARLLKTS